MMTETVSTTNSPPTIASTISCLAATARRAERAAQRQRAGIAHEDHGRRRVEPQEAEAAPISAGAEIASSPDPRHEMQLQVVREDAVADQVGDQREDWPPRSSPARSPGRRARRSGSPHWTRPSSRTCRPAGTARRTAAAGP
jgi:hypothetical protein